MIAVSADLSFLLVALVGKKLELFSNLSFAHVIGILFSCLFVPSDFWKFVVRQQMLTTLAFESIVVA